MSELNSIFKVWRKVNVGSLAKAAEVTGLAKSYLHDLENPSMPTNPSLATFAKLITHYKIPFYVWANAVHRLGEDQPSDKPRIGS